MSTAEPTPVDEHRRHLAHALHRALEDTFEGVHFELDEYVRDPQAMTLESAADLLSEAERRVRALRALAHAAA